MTDEVPREIIQKSINARVMVLLLTRRLMLIDIHMKFLKVILNMFQVKGGSSFCDGQSSKGNNSKSINARVMVLVLCTSSTVLSTSFTKSFFA